MSAPKLKPDSLVKITMEQTRRGKWNVTRIRGSGNGETATGFDSLEEAIEYIKAHDGPRNKNS